MKKGDLVRVVKRIPLPKFIDEDIGKFGIVTSSGDTVGMKRSDWVVVLLDGKFQLHAMGNLELVDAQD